MSEELKSTLKYLKNKNNTRRIKAITINEAQKVVEEIERLNNIINKVIADIEDVRDKNNYYDDYKVDNSILTYWIDLLKGVDKE